MKNLTLFFASLILVVMGCKVNKKAISPIEKIILDDVVVTPAMPKADMPFQAMETRVIDLLHTQLYLEFDYARQWVYGKALLKIKPYARPLQSIHLDARGFQVMGVKQVIGRDSLPLTYTFDSLKIHVQLSHTLFEKDTLLLFIQYVARPNEIPGAGGHAISDSRGLYFINPLGTDPNKPRQIWSQGETEFNSGWFPTNDAPNEKHTQDIYLLVDSSDKTLSNGLLLESRIMKNGKRQDHWQQLKPHAPYLTMIAIGDFVVTRDKWRNKEVSYYLEPAYAPYAKTIFGKTPQMIETFSRITGVDYPWDKFSQIVCRDFVSGAMENTSAVLHYESVQHTDREHLDKTHEDIIVHELFHQWFGDLVTCRSWSNLPLNESFATYGEYLYNEATYGKEYADAIFSKNLEAYLRSKNKYQAIPLRNYYQVADEVFDVVSYQKGSWILHQLRSTIGDQAFFKGINRYLTANAFQCTDFDDLRHAMEWASGQDLNPFFIRWFEGKGHPDLMVKSIFIPADSHWEFSIRQLQDSAFGLFNIPTQLVTTWNDGSMQVLDVQLKSRYEKIKLSALDSNGKIRQLTSFWIDPNGHIPGVIQEVKTKEAYLLQLKTNVLQKQFQCAMRAVKAIVVIQDAGAALVQKEAISVCLNQTAFYYQLAGLDMLEKLDTLYPDFEEQVFHLALKGNSVQVRDAAMYLIAMKSNKEKSANMMQWGLKDSSYGVMATCLQALSGLDLPLCLATCKDFEKIHTATIQRSIAWIYANHSKENKNAFYRQILGKYGFYRNNILNAYGNYLKQQNAETLTEGLHILEDYYRLSSDREKARLMRAVLNNLQSKSKESAVFENEFFQTWMKELEDEMNRN